MPGVFDYEPKPYEVRLLNWVFLPLTTVLVAYSFYDFTTTRNKCKSLCLEMGYSDFRFKSGSRYSIGEDCYCLTEEDVELKNSDIIPKGVQVF